MGRLFINGLLFPLTIILTLSIKPLAKKLNNPQAVIIAFILLTSLPSSFYIFIKRIQEVKNNNPWFYFSSSTQQVLSFLDHQPSGGVLVSDPYLASLIPAHAGQSVYFGIKDQTPDYFNKLSQATSFYQNNLSAQEAKSFLAHNKINYIIVPNPSTSYSFLTQIYKTPDLTVYQLTN